MNLSNFYKLLISFAVCLGIGAVGGFFTADAIPEWYAFLNKPSFNPPNWLFGPVWTFLYALMAVSLFLVWKKGLDNPKVKFAFWFFVVHLGFNLAWSFLFFGLRNPLLGLVEIVILWVMIAVIIKLFYGIQKIAAYLLIPYLLWVSFATLLNYFLYRLN